MGPSKSFKPMEVEILEIIEEIFEEEANFLVMHKEFIIF